MQINIYRVGAAYWFAAETPEAAVEAYKSFCKEFCDDEPEDSEIPEARIVTDDQINRIEFHRDEPGDTSSVTFREELDRMIGAGATFPCFFATSER